MQTRYYKAPYGPVTVVIDEDFYDFCYNLDSGQDLVVEGELTEDGETFKEMSSGIKTHILSSQALSTHDDVLLDYLNQVLTNSITRIDMLTTLKSESTDLGSYQQGSLQLITEYKVSGPFNAPDVTCQFARNFTMVESPRKLAGGVIVVAPNNQEYGYNVQFIVSKDNNWSEAIAVNISASVRAVAGQDKKCVWVTGFNSVSPLMKDIYDNIPSYEEPPENPYQPPSTPGGGTGHGEEPTDGGGGNGTHDDTDDPTEEPDEPTLRYAELGFHEVFIPSAAELKALQTGLWSSDLGDKLKDALQNPMDFIISLMVMPFAIELGPNRPLFIGGKSLGVYMHEARDTYKYIDCGSFTFNKYWGAYIDYNPYTQVQIYLPYIGVKTLDTHELIGKRTELGTTVSVSYRIDITSGACAAFVKVNGYVRYSFTGVCGFTIPVSGAQYPGARQALIDTIAAGAQIAGQAAIAAAGGGPLQGALTGGQAQAMTPQMKGLMAAGGLAMAGGMYGNRLASNSTAMDTRRVTMTQGSFANGAFLDVQKPYLIITRPNPAIPQNVANYTGYPSLITEILGDLKGFTIVRNVHLTGIPATEPELQEIEEMLHKGVEL